MFNIGDRVVCIKTMDGFHRMVGLTGTIKLLGGDSAGVVWDVAQEHMHNLSGECEDRRGWWIECECIEFLNFSLENE